MLSPGASVEFHRFRGRRFVAGDSWGVEVRADASPTEVGRLLLRGLDGERARRRPLIETLGGLARRERAQTRGRERFCRKVVGVDVSDYHPEIRLELLDLEEGELRLRPLIYPIDPKDDTVLPVRIDAEELGRAALAMLQATPPHWPASRTAAVHVITRQRLLVYPSRFWAGEPLRIVALADGPAVVGQAVQSALADSDALDPSSERDPDFWERLLGSAGLTTRQLAGRRAANVSELADGSFEVSALRAVRGGWEGIGDRGTVVLRDPSAERLGDVVLAAVDQWDPWTGGPLAEAV